MKTGALANLARRANARYGEARGPTEVARVESQYRARSPTAERWAEPEDIVEISPEAVFRYMSVRHDPHRMSAAELHRMTDELSWWGAITNTGRTAVLNTLYTLIRRPEDQETVDDLVERFRGWRDDRLSQKDIVSTRQAAQALAVLERVAHIRRTLMRREGR